MNRKIRRRRKRIKLMSWSLVLLVGVLAASFAVKGIDKKGKDKHDQATEQTPTNYLGENISKEEPQPEEKPDISVRI